MQAGLHAACRAAGGGADRPGRAGGADGGANDANPDLPVQMALQANSGARADCVDAFALTAICTDPPFVRVPTPVLRGTADRAMPSKAGIDRRRMAAMGAFAPVHDVARKAVVPPLMQRPVCPTMAGFAATSPNPMTMPA